MCLAALCLSFPASAYDDLPQLAAPPASEQALGHGRSAIWTLPVIATQYVPAQPTATLQAAQQAQEAGRFLEAQILLEEEQARLGVGHAASHAASAAQLPPLLLLRASLLLQGHQPQQALELLRPLQADAHMVPTPML